MRVNPVVLDGGGDYFTCKSGDRLFYREWVSTTPQKIVIGIHGLGGHSEYYIQVADQLIEHGISVYALDLKHHGHSDGRKGTVENFQELLDQLYEFVQFIRKKSQEIPIYLMGLSMGGTVILNYSLLYPEEIAGLICMAPGIAPKMNLSIKEYLLLPLLGFVYLVGKNKPIIKIGERSGEGSRNPLRLEYDQTDEYRLEKVSMRYLLQVNKWNKKVLKHIPDMAHPILIMMGTNDNLVSLEGVKDFYEQLTVEDKILVVLEGAYHCLFSDPAMLEEMGWDILRKWLSEH